MLTNRKQLRDRLRVKLDEYGTYFTIHGLAKGIYGGRVEKMFWLTCVALGVLIGFVILQGIVHIFYRQLGCLAFSLRF